MVTITHGNQPRSYLETLRYVFEHGLQDMHDDNCANQSCTNCRHKSACNDVQRAIRYINSELSSARSFQH